MSYPLSYKEKLPLEINNSYKELTPNDTVITVVELNQYVSYLSNSAVASAGFIITTGINDTSSGVTTSAYGQQFIEVLQKYNIGASATTDGPVSSATATQGHPTDTYPSLTATSSGILLFTIPKNRYGAGVAPQTLALTGKKDSLNSSYTDEFILSSSVTSSIFGKDVEIFPNPYFKYDDNVLDSRGVSGFFFNDEGLLGIVSSSANDSNGYNALSSFASAVTYIGGPQFASGNGGPFTVSFNSQILMNVLHFTCKINPDELNFSLNPSAFLTTAEGGSASYGYNYVYRLPKTLTGVSEETSMGDTALTYGGDGSTMTTTSLSSSVFVGEFQPYVTGVGLYNDDNELLAIGKLGQPLKKSTTIPMTFTVSIDI